MPAPSFVLDRRLVLKALAASAVTAALPARAQTGAEAVLLTMSDLHAPYARIPAMLDSFKRLAAEAGAPAAALINGDIFERGNVVCQRSVGAADFAFLKALADEMPVIVNLGNHETAVMDDMASFVARADAAGVQVISNLMDRRTGRFYAPVADQLGLGGLNISLLGLASTNPFVYRKPVRDSLTFLDPAQFVADALPGVSADADVSVVMSHLGVSPDKEFIGALPEGTVMQGAHDHLDFHTVENGVQYMHGAAWGRQIGMISLTKGGATSYTTHDVAPVAGDAELTDLIAAQMDEHLEEADKAIIADIPRDFDMHASILIATDALRNAAEADIAMIGHTTFGAPLSAGALNKYDFDSFVRFGGGIRMAEVTGTQLADMIARANQFTATDLSGRTGDYVHVAELDIAPDATYRLAVNGWTAINQTAYLGTTDLPFEPVDGLELKAIISEYLAKTFP